MERFEAGQKVKIVDLNMLVNFAIPKSYAELLIGETFEVRFAGKSVDVFGWCVPASACELVEEGKKPIEMYVLKRGDNYIYLNGGLVILDKAAFELITEERKRVLETLYPGVVAKRWTITEEDV